MAENSVQKENRSEVMEILEEKFAEHGTTYKAWAEQIDKDRAAGLEMIRKVAHSLGGKSVGYMLGVPSRKRPGETLYLDVELLAFTDAYANA